MPKSEEFCPSLKNFCTDLFKSGPTSACDNSWDVLATFRGHGFSENNRFLDKSPYWQLLHKALLSITFSGLDDDPTHDLFCSSRQSIFRSGRSRRSGPKWAWILASPHSREEESDPLFALVHKKVGLVQQTVKQGQVGSSQSQVVGLRVCYRCRTYHNAVGLQCWGTEFGQCGFSVVFGVAMWFWEKSGPWC